jgi:quinoprotein relay system zinc metallohydrolase 2
MPRLGLLVALLLLVRVVCAAPLAVSEVAAGIFVHQGVHEDFGEHYHGDIANIGFVIGRDAVAVIDSGGSYAVGRALREAIRLHTALPVRYVINTHVHADHIFGNAAFAEDQPEYIGHHQLPRAINQRAERYLVNIKNMLGDAASGSRLVPPSKLVDSMLTLDLGGRKLTLRAWPVAHTDNDLTVMDERSGTLWMGDLLFSERTPSIDGDIHGWLSVIQDLTAMPAQRVIPGHGAVTTDKNRALEKQRLYLQTLLDDLRRGIKEGRPMTESMDAAARSEHGKWVLFDAVNPRNATMLYPMLEWE